MGSLKKLNFAAHGYCASYQCLIASGSRVIMRVRPLIYLKKKCVNELRTWFSISEPKFIAKLVDANDWTMITNNITAI